MSLSTLTTVIQYANQFPLFNPLFAIALLVGGTGLIIFVGTIFTTHIPQVNDTEHRRPFKWGMKLAVFVRKFPLSLTLVNILISLFVTINMAIFTAKTTNLTATDVSYYLKVNLPAYDSVEAISNAQSLNSFNTMVATLQATSSYPKFQRTRRLQNNGPALSLVYHTGNWDNLLTEANLVDVCKSEQQIMANMKCLDTTGYKSAVPLVLNPQTCQFLTTYSQSLYVFGLSENAAYVQDNVDASDPQSAVLLSYFHLGSCGDSYSYTEFYSTTNNNCVSGIETCNIVNEYFNAEFASDVINAIEVSLAALVLCSLFMVLAVRGFIVAVITVYSIFVSVVCASAFLHSWGYGTFSAFNFVSIFILLGIGANAVLFFGSAWRDEVGPGQVPTARNVYEAYSSVGWSVFFTILAACVSLFSKLISPVIVISQLGAFLGVAVLVFYACFHFLIIPAWIYTGSWVLPKFVHRQIQGGKALLGFKAANDNASAQARDIVVAAAVVQPGANENDDPSERKNDDRESFASIDLTNSNGRERVDSSSEHSYIDISSPAAGVQVYPDTRKVSACKCINCSIGTLAILSLPLGLLFAGYFADKNYSLNNGIPQLFLPDSNLGQVMIVAQNYRPSIFTTESNTDSITFIGVTTAAPSLAPAPASSPYPYRAPTPSPAGTPSLKPQTSLPSKSAQPSKSSQPTLLQSFKPSLSASPTANSPTAIPSAIPSFNPSVGHPTPSQAPVAASSTHTDYSVTGCWGIAWSKSMIDGTVTDSFDSSSFGKYSNGANGLIADFVNLCSYVEANRDYLNVNPNWNRTIDCIDSQYFQAYRALNPSYPHTVSNALLQWAKTTSTSGSLLGTYSTNSTPYLSPLWVCANFSLRSYISSLQSDPSYASAVEQKWENAFTGTYSGGPGSNAKSYGVSIVVGSEDFAYPLLAEELILSIELAILISVVGIVFLLVVFTFCDVGMSIIGTLAMVTTLTVTVCVHIYTFTNVIDLLDIVVLVALMSMIVDFPIHCLLYYMIERQRAKDLVSSQQQGQQSLQNEDEIRNSEFLARSSDYSMGDGAVDNSREASRSRSDDYYEARSSSYSSSSSESSVAVAPAKNSFTALKKTSTYMRSATIGPLVLSVLAGLPLLFLSQFSLLRKTGQYIIILSVVSYVITCIILPHAMDSICETNFVQWVRNLTKRSSQPAEQHAEMRAAIESALERPLLGRLPSGEGPQTHRTSSVEIEEGLNVSVVP